MHDDKCCDVDSRLPKSLAGGQGRVGRGYLTFRLKQPNSEVFLTDRPT